MVVTFARKFKTEQQPIGDDTWVSVVLRHPYGIFGSNLISPLWCADGGVGEEGVERAVRQRFAWTNRYLAKSKMLSFMSNS